MEHAIKEIQSIRPYTSWTCNEEWNAFHSCQIATRSLKFLKTKNCWGGGGTYKGRHSQISRNITGNRSRPCAGCTWVSTCFFAWVDDLVHMGMHWSTSFCFHPRKEIHLVGERKVLRVAEKRCYAKKKKKKKKMLLLLESYLDWRCQ